MTAQRLDENTDLAAMVEPAESPNIELRTHVMLAEPNQEFKARDALKEMFDLRPYVPQEEYMGTRTVHTMFGVQRRLVKCVRPLFRGYLFVPLNMAWSWPFSRVPGLRGNGHQYLIHNGRHVILSEDDEALLRAAEYANAHPEAPILPYKVGDRVRIVDEGRFLDQVGKVLAIDAIDRIELLLGGLGRMFVQSYQIVATD